MVALVFWLGLLLGCREVREPENAPLRVDPSPQWESLLAEVVSEDGLVDYEYLGRHREALDNYIAWLSTRNVVPKNSRKKLAFWLNAYNALVLDTMLEGVSPASIEKPGMTFLLEPAFPVGKDEVSLWEIEHERIRMRSMDYRVHAAMSFGARSSPPLRAELYRQPGFDAQLRDQMRRWVEDPERGVRIEGDVAVFSPVFDWYSNDFSFWAGGANLCALAARHATGALRDELSRLSEGGCPHRFLAFDWSRNESR